MSAIFFLNEALRCNKNVICQDRIYDSLLLYFLYPVFLFLCLCFSLPFIVDITKKLNCISKSLNTAFEEPSLNWLTKLLIFSQTQVVLLLNKRMDFSQYAIHLPVDVSIHFFNDPVLGLYWIYILRIHGCNGGSIKSRPVETHKPVCLGPSVK